MNDENDVSAVAELEPQTSQEIQHEDGGTGDGGGAQQKSSVDLEKAMAELAKSVQTLSAPKPDAPTQITEEEKKQFWAIYDPSESRKDFFQKWFRLNPDATDEEIQEAKDLFAEVQRGLMRQAVVGSRNILNAELAKFREEFNPVMEYYRTQQAEATKGRFFEAYPALADSKYEAVMRAVAQTLADKEFKDEGEFFKVLADSTAEAIKKLIPDFDLGAAPTKQPTGQKPKLPRSSAGGGGGAGKGAQPHVPSKSTNHIDELEM